jgi:hypothetical protein
VPPFIVAMDAINYLALAVFALSTLSLWAMALTV